MKEGNPQVQEFLEEFKDFDIEKYKILQALRKIVFQCNPEVSEKIMYGGIMFFLATGFGGLFPSKKHVSFEFSRGFLLQDPAKLLEGKGKFRRHIKLTTLEATQNQAIAGYIQEAMALLES